MIQLTIRSENSADEMVSVRRFPFSVGRHASADLRSSASGIWDEHFQLDYRSSEGIVLVPGNGGKTSVDSHPIEGPTVLRNGAVISAGSLRIQLNIADPEIRSYRYREFLTWGTVATLGILQLWLMSSLPH